MPVIYRVIASVLVFSSDGKLLMGRKDPAKSSVYPDAWHIPGGGVNEDETLECAAVRELFEETGLNVKPEQLHKLNDIGHGEFEKTKPDGTKIWCVMQFNRFVVSLPQTAKELTDMTKELDDLIGLCWFDKQELATLEMVPGSREYMVREDFIDS